MPAKSQSYAEELDLLGRMRAARAVVQEKRDRIPVVAKSLEAQLVEWDREIAAQERRVERTRKKQLDGHDKKLRRPEMRPTTAGD
jgi:hypothetical protein